MSDRAEMLVFACLLGVVFGGYLACGTFFAWVLGISGGITWGLFVVAWPLVLGVAGFTAFIGVWALCSLIKTVLS